MTDTISVRFEKSLQRRLPRMEDYIKEIKKHKMSIGKAAEECETSIWENLEILKEKNIDWTDYSKEDLERDLAILE